VQALAPVLDHAVGGIAGEEVDDDVGILLPQPAGDREVALDVPEPDRARQPEDAPPAVPGRASGRRRWGGRGRCLRRTDTGVDCFGRADDPVVFPRDGYG